MVNNRPFSPSPDPEVFSDPEAEFEVDSIVGEEITLFGSPEYEIRWAKWNRKDKSNTTWQDGLESTSHTVHPGMQRWLKRSGEMRERMAHKSLAIALQPVGVPAHAYHTWEKANAYDEKGLKSNDLGVEGRYGGWNNIEDISLDAASSGRSSRTRETGRSSSQTPSSHTMSRGRSSSSVPTYPSSLGGTPAPLASSSKRPSPQVIDRRKNKRQKTRPSARERLLQQWRHKYSEAGAVEVHISDPQTPNEDSIPQLPNDFEYLEATYSLGDLVFHVDKNFLAECSCEGSCEDVSNCACHNVFEEVRPHAYDENGHSLLEYLVVVECNKTCKCSDTCRNRVAQHPRDVEIDIFRTEDRGWGSRALHDLPQGKFLGLYTGRLILREEAANLTEERRSYTFDIDTLESDDPNADGNPLELDEHSYSVEAYNCGNWTRFVNHSCEPNVKVISVMWDTLPFHNRPYLAFFTNQAVSAYTELTIDYDPKSALNTGKGKRARPPGSRDCLCRSQTCRGWVAV